MHNGLALTLRLQVVAAPWQLSCVCSWGMGLLLCRGTRSLLKDFPCYGVGQEVQRTVHRMDDGVA